MKIKLDNKEQELDIKDLIGISGWLLFDVISVIICAALAGFIIGSLIN